MIIFCVLCLMLVGGWLIDILGMWELCFIDSVDGIDIVFFDVVELVVECCFIDCVYDSELGCVVCVVIDNGDLDFDRFECW